MLSCSIWFVGAAWDIFLAVIWFLMVLLFLVCEFVFLYFWPEGHPVKQKSHNNRSTIQRNIIPINKINQIIYIKIYSIKMYGFLRHHPHRTRDPGSGSQDHHPSKNSVQKTICRNSTSNAPDDGHMYPKHIELRIH